LVLSIKRKYKKFVDCGVGWPPIVVVKVGKRIVIGDGVVGIFE